MSQQPPNRPSSSIQLSHLIFGCPETRVYCSASGGESRTIQLPRGYLSLQGQISIFLRMHPLLSMAHSLLYVEKTISHVESRLVFYFLCVVQHLKRHCVYVVEAISFYMVQQFLLILCGSRLFICEKVPLDKRSFAFWTKGCKISHCDRGLAITSGLLD